MRNANRLFIFLILSSLLVLSIGFGVYPAEAQGIGGTNSPMLINPCSTTDYDDLAAKTLGITATQLRVGLVSGKSLQELADSQNVALDTVVAALEAAHRADSDQALKDGLYMTTSGRPLPLPGQPANPGQPTTPVQPVSPNFTYYPFFRLGPPYYGLDLHNSIRPLVVLAQALDLKCADLVKMLRLGKSAALLAYEKNIKTQVLIDALMQAYMDARAADVKEGLIGTAEADGQNARLIERVLQMLSASGSAALTQFGIPPVVYALPVPVRPQPQPGAGGRAPAGTPSAIAPAAAATEAWTPTANATLAATAAATSAK